MNLACPYCHDWCSLVGGHVVYPHRPDLRRRWFYLCRACDAYVGCHRNTTNPLGTPANAELRDARQRAHAIFDPRWTGAEDRQRARNAAYAWLREAMGMTAEECHIGKMNLEQCAEVVRLCSEVAA